MVTSIINLFDIYAVLFPCWIMAVEFVHTLFNTVYFVVWFANGVLAEKLTCIRYSHLDGFVTIVHSFFDVDEMFNWCTI